MTVKGDAWFGSVKCDIAFALRERAFLDQVKANHGLFLKDYIEEQLLDTPGCTHIVLKSSHKEIDVIVKKIMCIIITSDARSTTLGEPYEVKFNDSFVNVNVRDVDSPDVISRIFQESNYVDKHNQGKKFKLSLEIWLIDDAYSRLFTTMVDINVTDTWKLASRHFLFFYKQGKH